MQAQYARKANQRGSTMVHWILNPMLDMGVNKMYRRSQ